MLPINFTGHRMELTPAMVDFTRQKFDKLERHFDKITAVNVVFDVEKPRQIVEATVLVSQGELHASSESENMYTSIDKLVHKLDRQLLKHKNKMQSHRE